MKAVTAICTGLGVTLLSSLFVLGLYLPHEAAFKLRMENRGQELTPAEILRVQIADLVTNYWFLGALLLFPVVTSLLLFRRSRDAASLPLDTVTASS